MFSYFIFLKRCLFLVLALFALAIFANTSASELVFSEQLQNESETASSLTEGDLWIQLRKHFELQELASQPEVQYHIHWFLEHPAVLEKMFLNSRPYLYYVFQQSQKKGLPAELALLPMIESQYDPEAYSSAGAAGIWQIMPATAMSRGLRINWWYDERRDLLGSTEAALRYLKHLHTQFDDWLLAIAAYDAGEGVIESAVENNRNLHKKTDYWSLSLPKETEEYLPRLIALGAIISQPEVYQVKLPSIPNVPYFSVVKVNSQMTTSKLSHMADVSEDWIKHLNSGFRRWATTPNESAFLLLPENKVERFKTQLNQTVGQSQLSWVYHSVQKGETLESIAKNYHTSLSVLQKANDLKEEAALQPDQGLLVPLNLHDRLKAPLSLPWETSLSEASAINEDSKIIRPGDSLKTTLEKLYRKNE